MDEHSLANARIYNGRAKTFEIQRLNMLSKTKAINSRLGDIADLIRERQLGELGPASDLTRYVKLYYIMRSLFFNAKKSRRDEDLRIRRNTRRKEDGIDVQ